ncbi:MAG TPA: AAA family ATPase [Streptosporangiaceae bacterium]|jgi:predicted ATPase
MMQRYIVTGAPGAGKTSVLRELSTRGFAVVAEAATDVIAREQQRGVAEPWRDASFLTLITQLQLERRTADSMLAAGNGTDSRPVRAECPAAAPAAQLHDRSVLCTLALARFLGFPVPAALAAETARVLREHVFEPVVFLLRPLGFIEATAARRISYADSLVFEKVHEAVYAEHGFELTGIPAAPVAERAAAIAGHIAARR